MERERDRIYVLLGTYNGARYIDAQIRSILAQTVTDWTLLARDDGSTDGTLESLTRFANADSRVQVIADDRENLGCVGNFSRLAEIACEQNARYVMFADQDDIWALDKVERTLNRMRAAEEQSGIGVPILVHTDLELVDQNDRALHPSFMAFQKIHHEARNPLKTLLVQNFVTGCTVMVNRSLLVLGTPIPADALMHDWWLAACASACGSIEFVPHPTMAYRRHGGNAVTVRGYRRTINPFLTDWLRLWSTGRRDHARAIRQAEALQIRLRERKSGNPARIRLIEDFVDLHRHHKSSVGRVRRAMFLGIRNQAFARNIALYLRLLTWNTDAPAGSGQRPSKV
jgi:glycosyltransferase involved in cell wall biosynthesis